MQRKVFVATTTWAGTLVVWFFLLCAFGVAPARAIDGVEDEWSFKVTPYAWAIGLKGDVTVQGQKSEPDISFHEIFEELNYGVMLEGEVQKGRFGAIVSTLFADLGDTTHDNGVKIVPDIKVWWQGFAAFYRLGPWTLSDSAEAEGPTLILDPYIGGRYTFLDADIKFKGVGEASGDEDWFEPVFGARTILNLSGNWSLMAAGDLGGFGIGSDFAWNAMGFVAYDFGLFGEQDARLGFGYRALHQDYSTGSGANKFEWDMTLHGPITAFSIAF